MHYCTRPKANAIVHQVVHGILPPNALRRDCNGKCIELIEGHALEVVVEVFRGVIV